ncbi:hypothetical protein ACQ86N_35150 [Puia sp. P3]|uniref:hypothetical protein n=1 Tax=Puia sp. P3 TaxID=3423952 RepID=UPI003D67B19D
MLDGEVTSHFILEGDSVEVQTVGHPYVDGVSVKVRSSLLLQGRLKVRVRFPYPTGEFSDDGDNWVEPGAHESHLSANFKWGAIIRHQLDTTIYFVDMQWLKEASIVQKGKHYFLVTPSAGGSGSLRLCSLIMRTHLAVILKGWRRRRRRSGKITG